MLRTDVPRSGRASGRRSRLVHLACTGMLSSPPPVEAPEAAELRGRVFTDLDRLAFALEMEAAELLALGREAQAARVQEQRLGVRLAQRLVAGVWADEVDGRLQRWAAEYEARLAPPTPVAAG